MIVFGKQIGLFHRVGPVAVALQLLSLVLIASTYDNTNVVLAKHAHKVKHGLFVGPLGSYVFVLAFQGRLNKTGVNVVVGGCRPLKDYTILIIFNIFKILIILFELFRL